MTMLTISDLAAVTGGTDWATGARAGACAATTVAAGTLGWTAGANQQYWPPTPLRRAARATLAATANYFANPVCQWDAYATVGHAMMNPPR
jgi:hypothetical protein